MRTTPAALKADLEQFGAKNIATVKRHCEGSPLRPEFVLATGTRESNLTNVEGDFHGGPVAHAKGWLQINDVTWKDAIAAHPGVKVGTWAPYSTQHTADDPGYVLGLAASLTIGLAMMLQNYAAAKRHATAPGGWPVTDRQLLWIAAAAYNRGIWAALRGWSAHHDPDVSTAGGDYGADVLERMDVIASMI